MIDLRTWLQLWSSHPALTQGVLAAALLLVLGVRAALHRTRVVRRLDSALTLIALALLAGLVAALARVGEMTTVGLYAYAFFIAAAAIGTVRFLLVLLVDLHLRERRGAAVSTVFRDVTGVVIYFLIIMVVLRGTLDINLASLIATSAVLTAIVGLAFQDVLGSVISGIVLALEGPFEPDDWIRVGAFEGQVVETGWRTTKIRTRVNEVVTLPNMYLAREPVVNYSRPDPRYGDTLRFEAGYEAPPHSVKQAIAEVLTADPAVLSSPAFEVRTTKYNESGIEYAVRYWLTDFTGLERIRDRLMTNFWYALRRAGVRIPFPARDLYVHAAAPGVDLAEGDVAEALSRVTLFEPLGREGIELLAGLVRRLLFGAGETIVREGDPGDSFFVIERGSASVLIGGSNGEPGRQIGRLAAGDWFGEMSLLAGEPRSATVVVERDVAALEVGRAAFEQIVVANPALLEPICQLATHRADAQREQRRLTMESLPPLEEDPAAQRLLRRIREFLGIRTTPREA